jgi:hypothetical protein
MEEETINVTRQDVIQAFAQAFCSPENAHKEMDAALGYELVRILFKDPNVRDLEAIVNPRTGMTK